MAAAGETLIGIALAYEVEAGKQQGTPIDVIFPSDGVAWTSRATRCSRAPSTR
jgi:ABC-type Fe3+ transport system substrate-binding protein